jgi:hypothetical protein
VVRSRSAEAPEGYWRLMEYDNDLVVNHEYELSHSCHDKQNHITSRSPHPLPSLMISCELQI